MSRSSTSDWADIAAAGGQPGGNSADEANQRSIRCNKWKYLTMELFGPRVRIAQARPALTRSVLEDDALDVRNAILIYTLVG
jgi:hypothetical protein